MMLTEDQGIGGDEAARLPWASSDGEAREPWAGVEAPFGGPALPDKAPLFPSHRPDAWIQALHTSSAGCPVCAGGFVCRGSYRGLS